MLKAFQILQRDFAAHLRDPQKFKGPEDVEDRRMAIYRGLIYRNVESFMANGFPVLRKIMVDEQWHDLVRKFLIRHRAHTPYFPKLTGEFLQYLIHECDWKDTKFPFVPELADYELAEATLLFDERVLPEDGYTVDGDVLAGIPVLNPLTLLRIYHFPVHRISVDFQPQNALDAPVFLLLYRDQLGKCRFVELNRVSATLIDMLQGASDVSGRQILDQLIANLQHPDPAFAMRGGTEILQEFLRCGILLGARSPLEEA
ncbi:MAG: HvfC family RiPP maturation protein [Candidatus Eutrophobiaceae bacterium]